MNKLLKWLAAGLGILPRIAGVEPVAPQYSEREGERISTALPVPATSPVRSEPGCGTREMARRRRQIERGALQCSR
ncbi:hypothetical protein [Chromobacterium violaceum]|uniref:hypothetical protein n=1 Tax=Chromobacterium violaceum TaxID=536 RepID=UPI00194DEA55|nr:hypothetical protein [Chromobacterium violaceum]QRO34135.1 hypothetical protein I6K04_05155 [Chromobacterium violaceum]QRQ16062.1 hypothetical protein I6K03_17575 [Chromobacterium violaceum]